jgi:hypothetical protein
MTSDSNKYLGEYETEGSDGARGTGMKSLICVIREGVMEKVVSELRQEGAIHKKGSRPTSGWEGLTL